MRIPCSFSARATENRGGLGGRGNQWGREWGGGTQNSAACSKSVCAVQYSYIRGSLRLHLGLALLGLALLGLARHRFDDLAPRDVPGELERRPREFRASHGTVRDVAQDRGKSAAHLAQEAAVFAPLDRGEDRVELLEFDGPAFVGVALLELRLEGLVGGHLRLVRVLRERQLHRLGELLHVERAAAVGVDRIEVGLELHLLLVGELGGLGALGLGLSRCLGGRLAPLDVGCLGVDRVFSVRTIGAAHAPLAAVVPHGESVVCVVETGKEEGVGGW